MTNLSLTAMSSKEDISSVSIRCTTTLSLIEMFCKLFPIPNENHSLTAPISLTNDIPRPIVAVPFAMRHCIYCMQHQSRIERIKGACQFSTSNRRSLFPSLTYTIILVVLVSTCLSWCCSHTCFFPGFFVDCRVRGFCSS